MIKQNLHTHSLYCDGYDTIEDMVLMAIDKGFNILGFSGHGWLAHDDCSMDEEHERRYVSDVLAMKKKYQSQIVIYLGIEEDYDGKIFQHDPFEFIIGSVHMNDSREGLISVDYSDEVFRETLSHAYDNDMRAYAKSYYEKVIACSKREEVDIMGHIDLIMKFNEDERYIAFDDPVYVGYACKAIDAIIANDKIIEVNTGAISRGYRKTPYPDKRLLAYIHEKKGRIMLTSDCHDRRMLDCAYPETLALIKSCGFTSMVALSKDGFIDVDIDEFMA